MPSENAVRLSSAQKRDLLGMSAAALITTALIAAPILLPHQSGIPLLVDPTVITASAVPTLALIPTISSSTLDTHVARSAAASTPTRRRERAPLTSYSSSSSYSSSYSSGPVRLASRPIAASAPVLMAVNTTSVRPSKTFGKRLAGIFTGDGTYSVRPFPTISTERQ